MLQHINMKTDEISLDCHESTNSETFITLPKCWSFASNQLKSEIYMMTIDSWPYPEGKRLGWPAHQKRRTSCKNGVRFADMTRIGINLANYSPTVNTE